MAKYAYPAVFAPEEEGGFSVVFPDLENCYTYGDDIVDGLMRAEDVLALVLYNYEKERREIPLPSDAAYLAVPENGFVNFVACDTVQYRKMYNNKSVKKTLTIPEWLSDAATEKELNLSQVLQEALISKMQL